MRLEVYDALGRQKQRNEIPVASGQYVDNGIVVYTTTQASASLASGAYSSDMITPLTLTGDGVNGMILEVTGYAPYLSAGSAGHWDMVICDTTLADANAIGKGQFYASSTGISGGAFSIKAYVPPFIGTKTFRFAGRAGLTSQTITNQASANQPTVFTAQWAQPTRILGPGSPPAVQWFSPSYLNTFSDYAAPYGPVKYGKMPDGTVVIRGLCQSSANTNTNVFQLPAGYRPDQTLIFYLPLNGAMARVDIDATGVVFLNGYGTGAVPWLSFAGVNFVAMQ